jgi:hypothetical protein
MLLADLHIHTRWSDGRLSLPDVVDLFGRAGHDVIAITDHIVNDDSVIGRITHRIGLTLTRQNFDAYRREIDEQARRAWDEYRMLVIAGAELTQNRVRRNASAHVLALTALTYHRGKRGARHPCPDQRMRPGQLVSNRPRPPLRVRHHRGPRDRRADCVGGDGNGVVTTRHCALARRISHW